MYSFFAILYSLCIILADPTDVIDWLDSQFDNQLSKDICTRSKEINWNRNKILFCCIDSETIQNLKQM